MTEPHTERTSPRSHLRRHQFLRHPPRVKALVRAVSGRCSALPAFIFVLGGPCPQTPTPPSPPASVDAAIVAQAAHARPRLEQRERGRPMAPIATPHRAAPHQALSTWPPQPRPPHSPVPQGAARRGLQG